MPSILEKLQYPLIWETLNLLPVELANIQANELSNDPASASAPEHYRFGAFVYLARRNDTSSATLLNLIDAASADPDPGVTGAAISEILSHHHASEIHLVRGLKVISGLPIEFRPNEEVILKQYSARNATPNE
ncbi:MAG: hypothetical protein NXI26_27320 [bacterium]|nr:hypothetical protein [bacterium]